MNNMNLLTWLKMKKYEVTVTYEYDSRNVRWNTDFEHSKEVERFIVCEKDGKLYRMILNKLDDVKCHFDIKDDALEYGDELEAYVNDIREAMMNDGVEEIKNFIVTIKVEEI